MSDHPTTPPEIEDPPPLLSSWRNIYAVVMLELVVTILVFWLLTRWAA